MTSFYSDERCFWHGGGQYTFLLPVGGWVQPGGGVPESPETKRRLRNLLDVSGLMAQLDVRSAPLAEDAALCRVHDPDYVATFRAASATGGELGERTPFLPGGFEIAALSAGLAIAALRDAAAGGRAYALTRPPGHHCLAARPMGFCLLNNLAIAIEAVRAEGFDRPIAVVDWDVHHGNGTEAIFYERADVTTISLHQDRNYPYDTGSAADRGRGAGLGHNLNVPMPAGTGHAGYLHAMERIVLPALDRVQPGLIAIACGYDASGVDPLSRMLAGADTFAAMTAMILDAAARLGAGVAMTHEGGYSEAHVPFCGHATIATLAGSDIIVPDPLGPRIAAQQPDAEASAWINARIDAVARALDL